MNWHHKTTQIYANVEQNQHVTHFPLTILAMILKENDRLVYKYRLQ